MSRHSAFDIPQDIERQLSIRLAKRSSPGDPFPADDPVPSQRHSSTAPQFSYFHRPPIADTMAAATETGVGGTLGGTVPSANAHGDYDALIASCDGNPSSDPSLLQGAVIASSTSPLRNPSNQHPLYTDDAMPTGVGCQRNETVDAAVLTLLMNSNRGWGNNGRLADSSSRKSSRRGSSSSSCRITSSRYPTGKHRRGPRLTIFSEEFLRELQRRHGGSDMSRILHSATGVVLQTLVFFIMVMFLGVTPIVKEAALWDEEKGEKVESFAVHSPYVLHFGCSVLIANFAAWMAYGKVGLRDCWNCPSILFVSRVSVFYAVGESMELITLRFIDGTSWKILNQLKLPVTAILNYFLLGRTQTATQWSIIMSTSLSIVGYCLAMQVVNAATGTSTASVSGLLLGVINVLVVTFAGTVADGTYKQVKYPFFILVAQGRLSACLITYLLMICWKAYHGDSNGFFHGWTWRVCFLTAWLLVKDWSVTFVLKNLDSMWKALGTAMGLCVTYTLANLILRYNLHMLVFIFVLSVVVNIISYTLTRREQYYNELEVQQLQRSIDDQQWIMNQQNRSVARAAVESAKKVDSSL